MALEKEAQDRDHELSDLSNMVNEYEEQIKGLHLQIEQQELRVKEKIERFTPQQHFYEAELSSIGAQLEGLAYVKEELEKHTEDLVKDLVD